MHMLPPGISQDRRAPPDAPNRRQRVRDSLNLVAGDHVLLFIGSGFIKKGLDRAILSVAHLRATRPEQRVRLLIVGQDKARRFQRLAKRLGVVDAVIFLGGRTDVPDLLLAADALIHPALDEAAGIVLLEALVAGLPVLVTDVCGYAHHIDAAGAGLVLDSPFHQWRLDAAVTQSLDSKFLADCKAGGLAYAEREDLYSMHRTGAAMIEQLVEHQCKAIS